MSSYACPKCGAYTVRTQVSLILDIPTEFEHRLSKKNITKAETVIMGASWDTSMSYCVCGWSMSLLKTRLDEFNAVLAENFKLRTALEKIIEVDNKCCDVTETARKALEKN